MMMLMGSRLEKTVLRQPVRINLFGKVEGIQNSLPHPCRRAEWPYH